MTNWELRQQVRLQLLQRRELQQQINDLKRQIFGLALQRRAFTLKAIARKFNTTERLVEYVYSQVCWDYQDRVISHKIKIGGKNSPFPQN